MSAVKRIASVAKLIVAVEQGASLASALPEVESRFDVSRRALLRQMAYGSIRHYYRLKALREKLLEKPLKSREAEINALLLLGLYQLVYMHTPDHAVVKETVNAALILNKGWAKGLINAVLRNLLRQRETLLKSIEDSNDESIRYDHPQWFIDRCKASWPEKWQDLLVENNKQAPMTLRVNTQRISRADYLDRLSVAGIKASVSMCSETGIVLDKACAVEVLPGFGQGMVSVQDEAAQLSAFLMDCQPGERILDACAAPGGKTCHLLEHTGEIELHAVDVDPKRLVRIQENLDRLELDAKLLCGNAVEPDTWWDGKLYDRILLDAPCSATGVIRRHPDIKLLRRDDDIDRLSELQETMLLALWPLLKPGGRLVYATCSVLPWENSFQIGKFLDKNKDAVLETVSEKYHGINTGFGIQFFPAFQGNDGFFYSVLGKK